MMAKIKRFRHYLISLENDDCENKTTLPICRWTNDIFKYISLMVSFYSDSYFTEVCS